MHHPGDHRAATLNAAVSCDSGVFDGRSVCALSELMACKNNKSISRSLTVLNCNFIVFSLLFTGILFLLHLQQFRQFPPQNLLLAGTICIKPNQRHIHFPQDLVFHYITFMLSGAILTRSSSPASRRSAPPDRLLFLPPSVPPCYQRQRSR